MKPRHLLALSIFFVVSHATVVWGQPQSYAPESNIPLQLPPEPTETTTPEVEPDKAMTISIKIVHGASGETRPNTPVFLRAARVRGPFEPRAPRPKYEWASVTNEEGIATFPNVPNDLPSEGLRIHAVATYSGIVFDSPAEVPSPGRVLEVLVYERGAKADNAIQIKKIRMTIEPWEGYLVFRQTYFIENISNKALDTTMLVGEEYEKGLPLELPTKAQGIQAFGAGSALVVNSTVYWNGVLLPRRPVQLQAHFSMSAKKDTFVYEQPVHYPTQDVEVIVPLQTQFKKLPRLSELEMRPKGFSETAKGPGIFGLRDDIDFIGARGLKLEPEESFKLQLRGLPFNKPAIPWYVLAGAITSALLLLVFILRGRSRDETPKDVIRKTLLDEQEALLNELVALEEERAEGLLNDTEFLDETAAIRERLALILKKLEDIGTN